MREVLELGPEFTYASITKTCFLVEKTRTDPLKLTSEQRVEAMHAAENAVIEGEKILGDQREAERIHPVFGRLRVRSGEAGFEFPGARMVIESDNSLLYKPGRITIERYIIFDDSSLYQVEVLDRNGVSEGIRAQREAGAKDLNRIGQLMKKRNNREEYGDINW